MLALALLVLSLTSAHATCTTVGLLPDSGCTPGVVETTDLAIICQTSTNSRRHVTEATKRRVLAEYGIAWADRSTVEVDHLTPIEAGGDGASVLNLWPEPLAEARRKDRIENEGRAAICSGRVSAASVQAAFAKDWTTVEGLVRR
jgi:hypothetical protein